MFSPSESVYNLRDSCGKLYVPKPRTDYSKRSFSYSGASLWNGLPESLNHWHHTVELMGKRARSIAGQVGWLNTVFKKFYDAY